MSTTRIAKFAWGVLIFQLAVVSLGAAMKLNGYESGCGRTWPLCNGGLFPGSSDPAALWAYLHRLSSGLSFLFVIGLWIWAGRVAEKRSPLRISSGFSAGVMLVQVLVGLLLVWAIGLPTSYQIFSAFHLLAAFILLASLALTAYWSSGGEPLRFQGHGIGYWMFGLALLAVLGVLMRGYALVCFNVSLVQIYLLFMSLLVSMFRVTPLIRRLALMLIICVLVHAIIGGLSLALSAPAWAQFLAFLIVCLEWIILVLFAAANFAASEVSQTMVDFTPPSSIQPS